MGFLKRLFSGKSNPNDTETLEGQLKRLKEEGNFHAEARNFERAKECFEAAIRLAPDRAEAYCNLGYVLKSLNKTAEAETYLEHALSLNPDLWPAMLNLGTIAQDRRDNQRAGNFFQRVLELSPDCLEATLRQSFILQSLQRYEEAEQLLRSALSRHPDETSLYGNLALIIRKSGRPDDASALLRDKLEEQPQNEAIACQLALHLSKTGQLSEAERIIRNTIALHPEQPGPKNILGLILHSGNVQMVEAGRIFREVNETFPGVTTAGWNLALNCLAQGMYEEGWRLYEERLDKAEIFNMIVPPFPFPRWNGEPLEGKRILVWPEQGFGDEIQFIRYAPLLKQRGVTSLTVACKPPLHSLFAGVENVDRILSWEPGQEIPEHDYWVLEISLPYFFGTTLETIPGPFPYLFADEAKIKTWHPELPASGLKVGLVWKGNQHHDNDHNRSIRDLSMLAPLWEVPGISFVSLQKGMGEDEAHQPPAGQPLVSLGTRMKDFSEAAAIVSQLDLVICVDTAVAHLAGALGTPCWVMLPFENTDWRWLRHRQDSPWYPSTMTLFRQQLGEGWEAVICRLAESLKEFAAERKLHF